MIIEWKRLLPLLAAAMICLSAPAQELKARIAALTKEIKREPTSALYAERGRLRHQLGQSPQWIDDCIRSYTFDDIADDGVGELVAATDSTEREQIISRFDALAKGSAELVQLEAAIMHAWTMYGRALPLYATLASQGNADADIYHWYADCALRVNGPEAALDVLTQAADRYPADDNLKFEQAKMMTAAGRYDDAITALDALIERYPDNEDLYRAKIAALQALRDRLSAN